jgi:hypothetical protein
MKQQLKLMAGIALALPVFTFGIVAAESTPTTTNDDTTTQTTTEDKTELNDRITKRKAALKIKLTNLEKARLKLKCVAAAKGPVKRLSGRINGLETSRNEVYTNLVNRLTKLSDQIKTKNLDTTTLDEQITTLKGKIDNFKTDLETYKTAVSDLSNMDCASDPDGFKASLEDARAARAKLATDSSDIKTYLNETIKPTLVALRNQLETKDTTSEEN